MIFPFKETNFPTIPFNIDIRKKYKFITDKHFEPITIRAHSTDGAIHRPYSYTNPRSRFHPFRRI